MVPRVNRKTFSRGDLVQLRTEYEVMGNPSLFRIKRIHNKVAILGQLSVDSDGYGGVDTAVDIDSPELIAPHPEILEMYSRHVR